MSEAGARRDAATPVPPQAGRWLPAAVFASTLVVASVLLFIRVPTTTIELDGTFTGLAFVSAQQQQLNRPLSVSALGAAGLKEVQLPGEVASRGARVSAIRIAVDSAGDAKRSGSIVVDRIVVPALTQVRLSRTDVPRQYRISLRSATPITVHADVMGTVTFAPAGARAATTTLGAPRPVDFTGTTGALDLDVTLAVASPAPRWQQLAARDLQVYRVEDEQDAARPLARPVSTILAGTIYFESLGGGERRLRAGEMLRFGGASGTILTLDLREDAIAATFQGDVREMRSGAGEHPRSFMPTLLEWLRQRQGLSLLWGTALYLFGISMTLRRWWRGAS